MFRIDSEGRSNDGYESLDEKKHKWIEGNSEEIVDDGETIWLRFTGDAAIFALKAAGKLDVISEDNQPAEIDEADNLSKFDMWLDSPSENIGEEVGKIAANIGYDLVNAPYSLLTGHTIGGSQLNSPEKVDAFVDYVPGLVTGGFTKTVQVVKTTMKGLKGFNKFVKRTPGIISTEGFSTGLKWQQRAGQLFQKIK